MAELKKVLTDITAAIVDDPASVVISETENDGTVCFELSVADGDVGKVIGRRGRIAKAIRLIMKAAASGDGKKVSVDIK